VQHSKHTTPNNVTYQHPTEEVTSAESPTDPCHPASLSLLTQSINQPGAEQVNKKIPLKDVTADSSLRNQTNSLPFSIPPKDFTTGQDTLGKDDPSDCCELDENFFSLKNKKRERQNVSHVSSRRRTLSPTTSRNMLLDALETDDLLTDTQETTLINSSVVETLPETLSSTSSLVPQEATAAKVSAVDPMELVTKPSHQSAPTAPDFAFASVSISQNPSKIIKETVGGSSSSSCDQAAFKGEALKRFRLRQEIARWKYSWEIVSYDAAEVALKYFVKRADTTLS
jgi:hypothetical protein